MPHPRLGQLRYHKVFLESVFLSLFSIKNLYYLILFALSETFGKHGMKVMATSSQVTPVNFKGLALCHERCVTHQTFTPKSLESTHHLGSMLCRCVALLATCACWRHIPEINRMGLAGLTRGKYLSTLLYHTNFDTMVTKLEIGQPWA